MYTTVDLLFNVRNQYPFNSQEANFADFTISFFIFKTVYESKMFTISCSSDLMQKSRIAELRTRLK